MRGLLCLDAIDLATFFFVSPDLSQGTQLTVFFEEEENTEHQKQEVRNDDPRRNLSTHDVSFATFNPTEIDSLHRPM